MAAIEDHAVFQSGDSDHSQMPVEQQLAIALYLFGHYGNAASQEKAALWAGISHGTISNIVKRVIEACCSGSFAAAAMKWPDSAACECAKAWVESKSLLRLS